MFSIKIQFSMKQCKMNTEENNLAQDKKLQISEKSSHTNNLTLLVD